MLGYWLLMNATTLSLAEVLYFDQSEIKLEMKLLQLTQRARGLGVTDARASCSDAVGKKDGSQ